ncbi:hypothetical protein R1flu_006735 [Riccia fluitans]|uniref:Uncharacterized protein n=1 Tax=Riccia fluitans TaxID=41844 RepID=A0ABD1YXH2_9MARC
MCTVSAPKKHAMNRSGEAIGRREERGSRLTDIPYALEESIEGSNKEDCDHFLHLLHERRSKPTHVEGIPLPRVHSSDSNMDTGHLGDLP